MKTSKKLIAIVLTALFLTACGSKYRVKVDLTEDQKAAIEREIIQIEDYLADYSEKEIPGPKVTNLAEDYAKLGDLGKAIDIYNEWLDKEYKVPLFLHNLGRLYERVGETDLAVAQYRYLIDTYQKEDYLYDITWAYINAKKRKEAEKYFNLWQLKFSKTDEATQEAIKKLRDEEQKVVE